MVRYTFETVNGRTICKALNDKNSVINMPMQRFRDEAGCIGWLKRLPNIRTGLIKLMKSEGVDPEDNNCTKDFGRELTREEQLEVKKGENSIFPVNDSAGEKDLSKVEGSRRDARESKKRCREDAEDGFKTDEDGADHYSGILSNNRNSFAEHSQTTRSSKRIRTSKRSDRNTVVAYDGEHEAHTHSTNIVQMLRTTSRVQSIGTTSEMPSRRRASYCKPARPSRKRPEYLQQFTDEDSDTDHEMSDDDADMNTEMSASDFEGPNKDDNAVGDRGDYGLPTSQENEELLLLDEIVASGEMPNHPRPRHVSPSMYSGWNTTPLRLTLAQDRLAPARGLKDYFGSLLPHQQDLEVHRASIRQMLGEDSTADDDGDSVSSPYGYRKRSVAPVQIRHHEGIQKAQTALQNQKRTDIRAAKDAHAKSDYRRVAPANKLQCQNIERALQATREAFFEYTGFEAPTTKRTESYTAQWNQIRSDFEEFDWSEQPDAEAPYFPHLPAWHISLENMPAHVKDTM
jgi:hypothetical protein